MADVDVNPRRTAERAALLARLDGLLAERADDARRGKDTLNMSSSDSWLVEAVATLLEAERMRWSGV